MDDIKTLYTGGSFDLFHLGHVNFLRHCRKLSNNVVVCLNTDEFITRFKGKSPVYCFEHRKEILLACKYVDKVIENIGCEDSKPTIMQIRPQIIAVGDDWAKKDYYKQMQFTQEWLDSYDITLVYIPYTKGISSTIIRDKL